MANEIPADKNDSSLTKYIQLKKDKNFPIERGISHKWLNEGDNERKGSGLNFEWPIVEDEKYKKALKAVSKGESPNNISCILTYSVQDGAKYMWMGDMETDMQQEYYNKCKDNIPQVDILFQPHHGRQSGSVPQDLLEALSPKLIIVGNAPSGHIDYGNPDKTITQNSAGDIVFLNNNGYVEILTQYIIDNVPSIIDTKESGPRLLNNKCWYKVGILKV